MIVSEEITPDSALGGFNQPIAVLTSPYCVSACEITAAHLKYAGRAVLIGQSTSGTGAGFYKDNEIDSTWKADAYDAFSVRIPNMLFGVARGPVDAPFLSFSDHQKWLMENRPVHPNISLMVTPEKYTESTSVWLDRIRMYFDQGI